jgi:hypothetical protein
VKKFFNFRIIIVILCFLFVCCYFVYQSADYEKIADRITVKTALKLKKEKGLNLIAIGGGMMHDIQRMSMEFNFYKVVDMKMARELLVYSVEEYLSAINSSEKVRQYLHNYPFTSQNVKIVIYFYNQDRFKVPSGKISIVAARRGTIEFFIDDPEINNIKSIHEETYQEALKTVSHK